MTDMEFPEMESALGLIAWAAGKLEGSGVFKPRLNAELLLAHVTGRSRVDLYACPERPVPRDARRAFAAAVERRAAREPLQYITASRGFRHLDIFVDRRVLIPRPETELLAQRAVEAAAARGGGSQGTANCGRSSHHRGSEHRGLHGIHDSTKHAVKFGYAHGGQDRCCACDRVGEYFCREGGGGNRPLPGRPGGLVLIRARCRFPSWPSIGRPPGRLPWGRNPDRTGLRRKRGPAWPGRPPRPLRP